MKVGNKSLNYPKMYGITRRIRKDKNSPSWVVSIKRKRLHIREAFFDTTYGGSKEAKAAATEYRDKILKKYPYFNRQEYCSFLRAHNTSGHNGVWKHKDQGKNRNTILYYWVASWRPVKGKRKNKYFSVQKYGDEQAYSMACDYHARMLEGMNQPFLSGPANMVIKQN